MHVLYFIFVLYLCSSLMFKLYILRLGQARSNYLNAGNEKPNVEASCPALPNTSRLSTCFYLAKFMEVYEVCATTWCRVKSTSPAYHVYLITGAMIRKQPVHLLYKHFKDMMKSLTVSMRTHRKCFRILRAWHHRTKSLYMLYTSIEV